MSGTNPLKRTRNVVQREKFEKQLAKKRRQEAFEHDRELREQGVGLSDLPIGTVLTRARSGLLVQGPQGGTHWCRAPHKGDKIGMPVPGDRVRFELSTDTSDGWIHAIEPRESFLQRYQFGRIKEVAANMERIAIIATPSEPKVSPRLVDRILVGASVGGLEAMIVINKLDLVGPEVVDEYADGWEKAGYTVLRVSAETGQGLHLLEEELKGHVTLLSGASGVGKSTLLNHLINDLELDTSAISEASGRGVHTTTSTQLYPFPGGGVVADSPGIREFFPVLDRVEELEQHFVEFDDYRDDCKYRDCQHLPNSGGCAVHEAVQAGAIDPARYESYLLMRDSMAEGPQRGRGPQIVI